MNLVNGYDLLGNIAIVKFNRDANLKEKKKEALKILDKHKSVRTILEKADGFSGRLRKQKTHWILGEKTKEALYKENGCVFRFNVDECYFSSRLSTDREEVAKQVLKSKKKEKVLVMFSGIGVYGIVIGKLAGKRAEKIVCVELNRACNRYALDNVRRNKLTEKVEIVQGDVRRVFQTPLSTEHSNGSSSLARRQRVSSVRNVIGKDRKVNEKFDRIFMGRPNLKDDFLDVAFSVSKKGTIIHYHGFYHEIEKKAGVIEELILDRAKKAKKKVRIIRIKKAGEIAPYKFRYRVDFKVL